MGIRKIKVMEDLPFEEGKTYMTKFATREMFAVTKIKVDKNGKQIYVEGIYEKHPHLGPCPLSIDRLVPEKIETGETREVCDHCSHPIETKSKSKFVNN